MNNSIVRNKAKILAIVLMITILLTLAGCTTKNENEESGGDNSENISITFIAHDQSKKAIANLDISFTSNDNLLEKLKKNAGLVVKDSLITEINGISQNEEENLYWLFTVNDEFASVGFLDLEHKDGDVILFTLTDVSK